MKLFRLILGLSALFIAGTAAYFSVTGIALLFSGSIIGVGIMAVSLEVGKLVTASYLHRNWERISIFFKFYFTLAVLILIFITSLGIFGFLSNAYQKTSLEVDLFTSEVEVLEEKKSGLEIDLERLLSRAEILTQQRKAQETRYDSLVAGENWVNAGRTYELIVSADEEISKINEFTVEKRNEISDINTQILEIESRSLDVSKDIGGFKFIAEAFDLPIDQVVKWFILIIIFVFDPLAVSLVVAYNSLGEVENKPKPKKILKEEQPTEVIEDEVGEEKIPDIVEKPSVVDDLGSVSDKSQQKPNEKRHL